MISYFIGSLMRKIEKFQFCFTTVQDIKYLIYIYIVSYCQNSHNMLVIFMKKNYAILLIWIFLTSTAPFIFFRWPGHPYKILTFISLLIMCLHLVFKNKLFIDKRLLFVISIQISYYIVLSLFYNDISNINLAVQLISLYISIVFILNFGGPQIFANSFVLVIL